MLYQLVQAAYWLALSIWFGGTVFSALAASSVFRVMREQQPVLPQVLAVNLEGQHGTLLGSTLMADLLRSLGRVFLACAAVVVVCLGLHFAVADIRGENLTAALVRIALATAAAGTLAYDRFSLLPSLAKHRQTYLDHADEPELANPAKDAFDREQQRSLTVLMITVSLLAGLVLFSAPITPASGERTTPLETR